MKSKLIKLCGVIIICIVIATLFHFKRNNASMQWINDLNYKEHQVHNISFGFFNTCPRIPVKIGEKTVKLEFDTGNAEGILITTAMKEKVDYDITGKITQYNSDGTYRGNSTSILLKSINVFGEEYLNVKSSLSDWKMFGDLKFNGTIGLEYFQDKVVTLDFYKKKIAVSNGPIDYDKLHKDEYIILPLIRSSVNNEGDLLFFEGEVNGQKSTIYLDTGSNRSFINLNGRNKNKFAEVKLGDTMYEFEKLRSDKILFTGKFKYPLRLAINSDLLKSNHFVITIDKIENNLIIYKR